MHPSPDPATLSPARVRIGAIAVDPLNFDQAIQAIAGLARAGAGGTVFTPNVDHVVRSADDAGFRAAYAGASLRIADGMPVVWASRWLGSPLPQKVSGSDWFEPLLQVCARTGLDVYFVGGREGAAALARERLQARCPGLRVVGLGPRTRDIEADPRLLDTVRDDLRRLRPAFAVVALGSPLQELWSNEVRAEVAPTVLLGLGSVLDIAADMVRRPPPWVSAAGLEWLYRLVREPRRLWRRYLLRGPRFLSIVVRQSLHERRRKR